MDFEKAFVAMRDMAHWIKYCDSDAMQKVSMITETAFSERMTRKMSHEEAVNMGIEVHEKVKSMMDSMSAEQRTELLSTLSCFHSLLTNATMALMTSIMSNKDPDTLAIANEYSEDMISKMGIVAQPRGFEMFGPGDINPSMN